MCFSTCTYVHIKVIHYVELVLFVYKMATVYTQFTPILLMIQPDSSTPDHSTPIPLMILFPNSGCRKEYSVLHPLDSKPKETLENQWVPEVPLWFARGTTLLYRISRTHLSSSSIPSVTYSYMYAHVNIIHWIGITCVQGGYCLCPVHWLQQKVFST